MRTARFLLLIVYLAGHTGLPLPLPAGVRAAGTCRCGDACQCAPHKSTAGCCSAKAGRTQARPSCCAARDTALAGAKARPCCGSQADGCSNNERPQPPVLTACGCQNQAPEGIAACSDPRVLNGPICPPRDGCRDWLAAPASPAAPRLVHSPDDPVPRAAA